MPRAVVALVVLLLVFPTWALAQSVVGVLGIASEIAPIEKRLQDSRDVVVRGYVFRVGTLNWSPGRRRSFGVPEKVNAAIIATLLIDEFKPSTIVEGVIVTGDVFVSDVAHRGVLRSTLGATAVEMEGAAVVQACRQFGVSCLVVRSITDRADGQAQTSYEQFLAIASENAATLTAAIIARLEDRAR